MQLIRLVKHIALSGNGFILHKAMSGRIDVALRAKLTSLVHVCRKMKESCLFGKNLLHLHGKTAFIIGSPLYSNLGDSAIFIAEKQFIKSCGWSSKQIKEVSYDEFYAHRQLLKWMIKPDDIIFGMGGGNMGNQWPNEEEIRYDIITDYPRNEIVVFPQTIHFINDDQKAIKRSQDMYNRHQHLTLIARERKSFEIMKRLYDKPRILLSPDIVFSMTMKQFEIEQKSRSGVLFVTRSDPEKLVDDSVWTYLEKVVESNGRQARKTDMYADESVTKENRFDLVKRKMEEFCAVELVITDRLHGMVFSALTGTPCIAFGNYNHKIEGTYDWIQYLPYVRYVLTKEEAIGAIMELLEIQDCSFDAKPLETPFDNLSEVIGLNTEKRIGNA